MPLGSDLQETGSRGSYPGRRSVDVRRAGRSRRKAKARLVILGYADPDLGNHKTWSPTLRRDTRNLILSILAHRKWLLFTLDAKTAFLLGKPSGRDLPLYVLLPRDLEEWPGEGGPRRLLKAAYGLAEAPLAWFRVLCETFLKCGFKRMSSDACLFVLYGRHPPKHKSASAYAKDYEDLPIVGIVGVHVDDLLCGGDGPEWEDALGRLTSALKLGDRKFPPVVYCGVEMMQDLKTHVIKACQAFYVEGIKEPSAKATDLTAELRCCVGSLIRPATQTRPDLCFDVSWVGSGVSNTTKEHITSRPK